MATSGPPASAAGASESDYRPPPLLSAATAEAGGRIRLVGSAGAGDRVRLATPEGQAVYAQAGPGGDWSLTLAAPIAPRLFGLSMTHDGQTVQSEGYLAVTPQGTAAQLRSGAGALVLGSRSAEPSILAVDFDSKGGAVVSGRASPRATLDLWADGVRQGRGTAGPDGAFSVALDEPVSLAEHRLDIVEGARRADLAAQLTPASPLNHAPYRATRTALGWRIDWMTPGGGLQTTLLPVRIEGGQAGASS